MALTGQFERSLDQKYRMAVPKTLLLEFADPPPDHLYVAKGYDHCLDLYSPEEFNLLAERLKERSSSQEEFRRYERLFFSSAVRLSLDSQSRVRLPDRLVQEASLNREVILVGVRNRAEVWDRKKWDEFQTSYSESFDEVARNALN